MVGGTGSGPSRAPGQPQRHHAVGPRATTARLVRGTFSNSFVVGQATSATIVPSTACGRRNGTAPVGTFIPLHSQGSDESMNVIVQLGTTVVASAASHSPSVAFARMQQPHAMQKVAVVTVPKPCTVVEPLVHSIKNEELQTEEKVDVKVKVEELQRHEELMPKYRSPIECATTKEQRLEILKLVLQDHNYVAPPVAELSSSHGPSIAASSYSVSGSMYQYGGNAEDDDVNSVISSGTGREAEPEGEETETAPEGEGEDDDSVTRCICDFQHDDGYMICCDKCFVWQHVDCMQIDRANIPELYSCERCQPRKVDKQRARALQLRKREELCHADSSTDSSSSSSPDCPTLRSGSSAGAKKRAAAAAAAAAAPAATTARRKSEPASGGTSKATGKKVSGCKQPPPPLPPPPPLRQRRESTTKEPKKVPTTRRKESKRVPVRRKSKSRAVVSDTDDDSDLDKPSPVQELRQWIEHYEEAVTNHYSPELRARISSIKVNGIHSDLRVGSLPATPKCRTTILGSGLRILYAAVHLSSNQPIIELRGKYMLSVQHHASVSMQNSRRVRLPPGPYIFFYRLPKDGTEVCVDTSTYGNDARFVRRSCKPNAEMRHCIEKGTLHLYLVTLSKVEKGAEITIAHDTSQENLTPISCACGNPDECSAFSRKNGLHEQISDRERRRRVRRSSTNDGDGQTSQLPVPAPASPKPSAPVTRRSSAVRSPAKQPPPPRPTTPPEETTSAATSSGRSHQAKTDLTAAMTAVVTTTAAAAATTAATTTTTTMATAVAPSVTAATTATITSASTAEEDVVVLSERKAAATSSATSTSSSSTVSTTTTATTTVTTATTAAGVSTITATTTTTATATTTINTATATSVLPATSPSEESNKKLSREDRKMAAILKAIERMEQQSQKTTQTKQGQRKETESVKKPEPKPDVKPDPPKKEIKKTSADRPRRKRRRGRTRTNSTNSMSTRRSRRDSVDSEGSSGDEVPQEQSRSRSPPSHAQEPSESPGHGLSTAAGLLLALANATTPQQNPPSSYRPHTPPPLDKLNSETLGGVNPTLFSSVCDSGGGSSSQGSTPPTPLSSACLLVAAAVDNLAPGFKFPKTKKGEGSAHAKAGSGSAKKRWLRQAISEEGEAGESPNSRAESPPGSDCVAPLKKRRLARESMSSEHSVTPPTTPTQAADSFQPKEDTSSIVISVPSCDDDDDDDVEEVIDVSDEVEVLQEIRRVNHPIEEDNSNGTEEDVCRGFEQSTLLRPVPLMLPQPVAVRGLVQEVDDFDESEPESAMAQPSERKVRKLSIYEYWQRKQRGSVSNPIRIDDDSSPPPGRNQVRHSSSSSSLSSDDETENPSQALQNLAIFNALDTAEDKKGGEDLSYMKWNSAPTMVEQQRENLTERLRREFGLFLSDDEEQERVRKQQSQGTEVAVKEGKKRVPPPPPPPHPPPLDTAVQPQAYQQGGQKFCHGYTSAHVSYSYPTYAMIPASQGGFASHQLLPPGRYVSSKKPYLLPTPPGNPVYSAHSVYASSSGIGRPGGASSSTFLTAAAAKAYFPAGHQ